VKAHLKGNGMAMKPCTIDDATMIAAPSSTLTEAAGRAWRSHWNHCKVKALSAELSNLYMSRHEGSSKITNFQQFQNGTQVGLVFMQCF
jgi:hypothetical protein